MANKEQAATPTTGGETVMISSTALQELLAAAVKQGVESGMRSQAPTAQPGDPLAQPFSAEMDAFRGKHLPKQILRRIPCKSEETGSSFVALCLQTGQGVYGKIVTIEEYLYPPGIGKHVRDGGIVPDGMQIRDANGQEVPLYKQWRWEEFWKKDLAYYNRRPFLKRYAASSEAVDSIPWTAGGEPVAPASDDVTPALEV